ncbi:MAG: HEAT repeat domain-containing protein [Acidobacteria bacterium]|nr:HEAT repeat domain-containing protein [Acidobacteriota bacterium]
MRPRDLRLPILLLAVAALAPAQVPRIGIIDFYGLRKVSAEKIRTHLGFKEGDLLPPSKGEVEDHLEEVPGVIRARLEAVCCEDKKAVLYIGVEEKGAPRFEYHPEPEGEAELPVDVVVAFRGFFTALEKAVTRGDTAEDLSRGHSLMADPDARAFQLEFTGLVEKNLKILREVLRNSADAEQRAMAAYLIGYAEKKRLVVDDLQWAMRDPDDGVRNNAMRSLGAIAVLAAREPEYGIQFSPTWFIEMLNSIAWSDRNKAAYALVAMTDKRDPRILDHIREVGLHSLVEMARWRHMPHALQGIILLGRLAGMPEPEIQEAWSKGEREAVIKKALAGAKK